MTWMPFLASQLEPSELPSIAGKHPAALPPPQAVEQVRRHVPPFISTVRQALWIHEPASDPPATILRRREKNELLSRPLSLSYSRSLNRLASRRLLHPRRRQVNHVSGALQFPAPRGSRESPPLLLQRGHRLRHGLPDVHQPAYERSASRRRRRAFRRRRRAGSLTHHLGIEGVRGVADLVQE
jgi:hypothetical protein